jgi:hypothetical protein
MDNLLKLGGLLKIASAIIGILAIAILVVLWANGWTLTSVGVDVGPVKVGLKPPSATSETPSPPTATPTLVLSATETATQPPAATPTNTAIPQPTLVKGREFTGSQTRTYEVVLDDGEIVVGQGFQFKYGSEPIDRCYAFLINGPGQFSFSLFDGAWVQYRIYSIEQAESLLQGEMDSLSQYCKPMNVVRLP